MPSAKIQLKRQFVIDRSGIEPLSIQIVRQLQEAIEAGRVAQGTRLPSTRSLAHTLGVSRNTVLTAYDDWQREALFSGASVLDVRLRARGRSRFQSETGHARGTLSLAHHRAP